MEVGRDLSKYDQAWNEPDSAERRRLLEEALTDDCVLVEPRGSFAGRDAIMERIEGISARFPGAKVELTTKVDEHNGFGRYGWRILDGSKGRCWTASTSWCGRRTGDSGGS